MNVDNTFLAWVASRTNGANVHDANMLLSNYKFYVREGHQELAETTRRMLEKFLISGHGSVRKMIGGTRFTPMITQFRIWEEEEQAAKKS